MQRTLIKETINHIGQKVKLCGWVNTRRDHGGIVFIDLRDISGLVQIVLKPELAGNINSEWVVCIEGLVKERPEKMVNPKLGPKARKFCRKLKSCRYIFLKKKRRNLILKKE